MGAAILFPTETQECSSASLRAPCWLECCLPGTPSLCPASPLLLGCASRLEHQCLFKPAATSVSPEVLLSAQLQLGSLSQPAAPSYLSPSSHEAVLPTCRCLQGCQRMLLGSSQLLRNNALPQLCRLPLGLAHRPWLQSPMVFSIPSHKPSLSSALLPQREERSCGFFQAPSSNFPASQGNLKDSFPVCSRE